MAAICTYNSASIMTPFSLIFYEYLSLKTAWNNQCTQKKNAPISSPEVPRHSPASTFGTLTCLIGIMVVLEAPGQNFAVSPDQVFVGRLA